jgi:acetyl esterase
MHHLISRTRVLRFTSAWFFAISFFCFAVLFVSFSPAATGASSAESPAGAAPALQAPSASEADQNSQVQTVLQKLAAANALYPKTVEEGRRAFQIYASLAGSPEPVSRIENRKIPGPGGDLAIRLYAARTGAVLPIFIFFHGGGFVAGTLDDYDVPMRAVANRCACLVVSVAYRLAPENQFPAATKDAFAATQWVAAHAAEIGGDPRQIAVGGEGAGGNLAAVVTLKARDLGGPPLVFQVLICPVLDATMLTKSRLTSHDPIFSTDTMLAAEGAYIPHDVELMNPELSPLFAKDLRSLPPAFVITDKDDPLLDEANLYAEKLKEAGVSVHVLAYPRAIHGFFLMSGALESGKDALEQIARALQTTFTRAGNP